MNIYAEQHILYLIMLITSFFLAIGLVVYTAPYRKRGQISDKLFVALEACCILGLIGDAAALLIPAAINSGTLFLSTFLTQVNGIMDIFHEFFDGILVVFIFYYKAKDLEKAKKLASFLLGTALVIVLYQKFLFSILYFFGNTPPVPPLWLTMLVKWVDRIYHVAAFMLILLMSRRLALYYLLAIATSVLMQALSKWGETGSMMNAQLLVFFHLYLMNHDFNGGDEHEPVRL